MTERGGLDYHMQIISKQGILTSGYRYPLFYGLLVSFKLSRPCLSFAENLSRRKIEDLDAA